MIDPNGNPCPEDQSPAAPITEIDPGTTKIIIPPEPSFIDDSGEDPDIETNVPGHPGTFHDFSVGLTRIFYSATDEAGNTERCEYEVEVVLGEKM